MRHLFIACAVLSACAPQGTIDLTLSSDRSTFDGRSERAIISVEAFDDKGGPGVGTVDFSSGGIGQFVEGTQLPLVAGRASATFRCNPSDDTACAGSLRLSASWRNEARFISVRVTPNDPREKPLWRVVPTLQPVTLNAAVIAPNQTVWAVGERGVVLPYTLAAGWGAPVATGTTQTLKAVIVDAQGSLTIVGEGGVVLRGQPNALRPLSHGLNETLTAVTVFNSQLMVATASGGVGLYENGDFTVSVLGTSSINALSTHQGQLVAVGNEGIYENSGGGWNPMTPPLLAKWVNVQLDADGLWLLGRRMTTTEQPVLVRGPGPDWKSASLPSGAVRSMAWGAGTADRYVTTDVSVFRQQSGAAWEDLEAPAGGNAAVVLGGISVLVVGPPGISLLRVR